MKTGKIIWIIVGILLFIGIVLLVINYNTKKQDAEDEKLAEEEDANLPANKRECRKKCRAECNSLRGKAKRECKRGCKDVCFGGL